MLTHTQDHQDSMHQTMDKLLIQILFPTIIIQIMVCQCNRLIRIITLIIHPIQALRRTIHSLSRLNLMISPFKIQQISQQRIHKRQ